MLRHDDFHTLRMHIHGFCSYQLDGCKGGLRSLRRSTWTFLKKWFHVKSDFVEKIMMTTFYLLWFRRRSYFWEFQIPIIYDYQHCQGLQLVYRVWKKWFHVKSGFLELVHDDNILPDFIIVQFFDCASGFINSIETYKHVSSIGSGKIHHKSHFINSSTLQKKKKKLSWHSVKISEFLSLIFYVKSILVI